MKTITIAEILHYAADKELASKQEQYWTAGGDKEKFSCCAAEEAVMSLWHDDMIASEEERDDLINRILKGLEAMGCPTGSTNAFGVDEGVFIAENQQARYAWLKFAAIIAEEQGV